MKCVTLGPACLRSKPMGRHTNRLAIIFMLVCISVLVLGNLSLFQPFIPEFPGDPYDVRLFGKKPPYLPQYAHGYKVILLWTTLFGYKSWYFEGLGTEVLKNANCPEVRCLLTANKDRLHHSDIVLFHTRNMPGGAKALPKSQRPKDQIWAFFSLESPFHTYASEDLWDSEGTDLSGYDGNFNWTITYRLDSDIQTMYGTYVKRPSPPPKENHAAKKSKLAVWFVSNCATKYRMTYVQELQKYMPVDIYGKCGMSDPCAEVKDNGECIHALQSQYKFSLAFENGQCKNYITEKFWNSLRVGMVPVVLGARMEDYTAVAPPNSFIFTGNYKSPYDLAKYLLHLDRTDTEYNTYFTWREEFQVINEPSLICKICAMAHNNTVPKQTYKISKYWGVKENCVIE